MMLRFLLVLHVVCLSVNGFTPGRFTPKLLQQKSSFLGVTKLKEPLVETVVATYDPLGFSEASPEPSIAPRSGSLARRGAVAAGTVTGLATLSEHVNAIQMPAELRLSTGSFDPNSFVPVCAASDGFYRFLQGSAKTVVGVDNFQEYGPLIASGLLRVRLELCVVESFFNEAVGPFIRQNGLSWVLPLHETVETFLAGSVFALATTFILVGSTKILTVLFTYADFLIGGPLRLLGGFAFDRARGKPVTLDIGFGPFKTRVIGPKGVDVDSDDDWTVDLTQASPVDLAVIGVSGTAKAIGTAIQFLREILDAIDLFVGKSLVLWATAYVGFKFLHFKVFPDFPPF